MTQLQKLITNLKSPNKIKNKKVRELNNLVLYINKDTLFENFYDAENDKIHYEIITKKILLPYFKIKSRVMKKNMHFKIGEIGFKVSGMNPAKKGVVSSKTYVQCNSYYSFKNDIKRALLITTKKFDNFNQESLIKELLSSNEKIFLISKNDVCHIKQYEFYIRNCEPVTGILGNQSQVSIENKEILNIQKLKIAIIKVII